MVDFWTALANVRIKLAVSNSGMNKIEKMFFISLVFIAHAIITPIEFFGPPERKTLLGGIKFCLSGLGLLLMILRSLYVVKCLDSEISKMKNSAMPTTLSRGQMIWQLRIKFFIFLSVCIVFLYFIGQSIYEKFNHVEYIPPLPTSDRSTRFDLPLFQLLYLLGSIAILVQFSHIIKLMCWGRRVYMTTADKSNSASPNTTDQATHLHVSTKTGIMSDTGIPLSPRDPNRGDRSSQPHQV